MNKTFQRTAFNLSAKSMLSLMLLLIAMLMPQGAWATDFISEIKVSVHEKNGETARNKLTNDGYTIVNVDGAADLNGGGGGYYVYIGYKTSTNAADAITGLLIVESNGFDAHAIDNITNANVTYNGKNYYRCANYDAGNARLDCDLNRGRTGTPDIVLFYTKDGNTSHGGTPLTSISVVGNTTTTGVTYTRHWKYGDAQNGTTNEDIYGNTNQGSGTAHYITYTTHTHAYTAAFSWATNGKTCTATVSCSCGDTHSDLDCAVTSEPKSGAAATCTVMGWTTYTAKVTSNGKDFSDTKDVQDIAIVPHTFAANDAVHGVCTVCQHGFLRYTSKNNVVVTQKYTNSFYNGNTLLTVLSNANGVIEFNKPLTKIGEGAFDNKTDLTSVTFPYTLTTIDKFAFSNCTGLTATLTIPSSVTNIGEKAFVSTGISTVRNESTTPQSYNNIFGTLVVNKALLVPASAVQTYRAANGWKSFKSINCIEHDYSQMSTDTKYAIKAVTCTTAGTYYYSCYCGLNENNASHTFTVAALGHSYTSQTATETYLKSAATCTADAVYYHKCSRCDSKGSTTWTNTGSALGHSYGAGSWSWADDGHSATCTRTCSRDANHKSSASVTLGNGITSEQQVAPNCTTKGTTRYTASATVEGTQYNATKDVVDIAALDHDYSQVVDANYLVSAATCIADAVYHEKCSRCTTHGAEWSATGTATGNHSYTNNTLTASPIEDGLYAYACDNGCGTHTDDHIIKDFNGAGNHLELTKNGSAYSAASLAIEDGKAFQTPVAFTTSNVSMERAFTQSTSDAVVPATIMLPFSIDASALATEVGDVVTGTKFYGFTSLEQNPETGKWEANMDRVKGTVEAYTPYMIVLTEGTSIDFGSNEVTFAATPAENNNTTQGEWTFVGTSERKVWTDDDFVNGEVYYGYAASGQSTAEAGKFVKVGTDASIKPLRSYIMKTPVAAGPKNAPTRATDVQLPNTIAVHLNELFATGIGELNIETGEFTFDGWYDLNGNRISEPVKNGISIKNNKKVIIK